MHTSRYITCSFRAFPTITSENLREFWSPFHHRELRDKQYPPERGASRRAVRHLETRQQEHRSSNRWDKTKNQYRVGSIENIFWLPKNPLLKCRIPWERKGTSRTEHIPQYIVYIEHSWESRASKCPRCWDTPFKKNGKKLTVPVLPINKQEEHPLCRTTPRRAALTIKRKNMHTVQATRHPWIKTHTSAWPQMNPE